MSNLRLLLNFSRFLSIFMEKVHISISIRYVNLRGTGVGIGVKVGEVGRVWEKENKE